MSDKNKTKNELHVKLNLQAFIRAEKAGNGLENRIAYHGGIQDGNKLPEAESNKVYC